MNKVFLIIWREYFERIRKKSFIVMSFLGPILMAGGFALIIWLANVDKTEQKIAVIDESFAFGKLPDNDFIRFYYPNMKFDQAYDEFNKTDYTCLLRIYYNVPQSGNSSVMLYYKKSPGIAVKQYLRDVLEKKLYEFKLAANNIDPTIIKNARQTIHIAEKRVDETGKESAGNTDILAFVGFACGVLIFIFLTVYGAQVMRSVMEEKTSRIVEVIISSVKPFQLMMGKIIGVAFVGLTQFVIWILLTTVLTTVVSSTLLSNIKSDAMKHQEKMEIIMKQGSNVSFKDMQKQDSSKEAMGMIEDLKKVDFAEVAICFLLYFLGGYLFYSALFAAVGSAVDSEADTQQFMLPIMLPLIVGYIMTVNVMQNPEGNIAFWGSMIPFTSPVVMLARIPNGGVPLWQIGLSLALLVMGFLFTVWLAGRIYRTGILMYGKKVTWKELIKWVSYKG